MSDVYRKSLLRMVSTDLNIEPYSDEPRKEWLQRVVYSAIANHAYTALWDRLEENQNVSVVHFKNVVKAKYLGFKNVYGTLCNLSDDELDALANEIYDVYEATGCLYHAQYRLAPSRFAKQAEGNTTLVRGQAPALNIDMSGAGYYYQSDSEDNGFEDNIFGLSNDNIGTFLAETLKQVQWREAPSFDNFEFLRVPPKFAESYWVTKLPKTFQILLTRTTIEGLPNYYLLKNVGDEYQMGAIPSWRVEGLEWLRLAAGILAQENSLPYITAIKGKEATRINLGYLLPPSEENFYKLYSWPVNYDKLEFERIMATPVYEIFKRKLEKIGYKFKERTI